MQIRFHLDESVRSAVAVGLRGRGIEVTTPSDAALLGATDQQHLAFALAEHRVIVTHDDDFLRLAQAGHEHAGIAYCHQRARNIGQIVLKLTWLWRTSTAEDMHAQVLFL
jgi:predicted nuclease of predicted toxin-antitoxin system